MISVTEFVLCIHENVYDKCNGDGIVNNNGASDSATVENGDNDDDDIYDYAPAA
ncbi:hypothetical protein AALP_AA4G084200 [Arabis alpina]|uniref:Uncharacterized protein n=1 Tax=Arabis alpina TaxID=50452 RepID=A0A087H1Z8_ARAAL|nr:hypothetical protein AALP_AA4G084200 [Arabis alpina]